LHSRGEQSATVHLSLTRANQVLEETVRVFSTSRLQTQQLDLHLAQVGHFDNKVIYASVKEESEGTEHLIHLSKSLRERCQTAGLTLIDGDRFTPHVTLLKLSKDPRLNRKVKKTKSPLAVYVNYGKLSLIKFCFSSFFGFFSGDQGCGLPFVRKTR
jgi:2'-5' RNA ligase